MMRRLLWAILVGAAISASVGVAGAQVVVGPTVGSYAAPALAPTNYAQPPGYYGMAYGYPSFGLIRTYSAFSSSYGPGYGYGYPPFSNMPGRYGVGLWRPGLVTPGYVYGAPYYRTYPVPYRSLVRFPSPSVGYYAPGFGPRSFYVW